MGDILYCILMPLIIICFSVYLFCVAVAQLKRFRNNHEL
jgi:hypothetical protein